MKRLLLLLPLLVCSDVRPAEPEPMRSPPSALIARAEKASETPPKVDSAPVVILPDAPPPPPAPPPLPRTPTKLPKGTLYVVRCSVPCQVVDGVEGLVSIAEKTGPLTIYAKFVDSNDAEERTYTDKYLYLVTAVGTGTTDLIITPQGGRTIRRTIDAFAGPVPPPVPPVPPVPPPPVDPFTALLQAAYNLDADADKAKSLTFLQGVYKGMADQAAGKGFKTNAECVAWMKTVVEAPGVGLTAGQLVNLRKAIGADLLKAWGATTAPLTPADATKELYRIANALSGVK